MATLYILLVLLMHTYTNIIGMHSKKAEIVIQRSTPQTLYATDKRGKYQGKIYFDTTQCSIDRLQTSPHTQKTTSQDLCIQTIATLKQSGCLEVFVQKDLRDLLNDKPYIQECSLHHAQKTICISTQQDIPSASTNLIITKEHEDELQYKAFITDESAPVGFAHTNATSCTLNNLHVINEFKNMGIGKELFVQAMNDLRLKGCLHAYWKSLRPAVGFYKKQGATIVKDKGSVSMTINLKKPSN